MVESRDPLLSALNVGSYVFLSFHVANAITTILFFRASSFTESKNHIYGLVVTGLNLFIRRIQR